jgi:hypothetical protein
MQQELMEREIWELALLCTAIKADRRLLHSRRQEGAASNKPVRSMRWDPRLMLRSVACFGYSSVRCFEALFK